MQVVWLITNLVLLGLPAAFCIAILRESIRVGVAYALGFRVFGIRWGAGPECLRWRWGSVHHRFAAIPLGGDTRVASSRPQHHRLVRWAITVSPLVIQTLLLVAGWATGQGSAVALTDGLAPWTMFFWANAILLATHLFIPFETPSGFSSDLRLASILAMSGTDADRASRASELIMRIEHRLESGQVERARRELSRAVVQLGREPMLIQLEDRLARIELAPDPTAAARLDAMADPFDHAACAWDREAGPLSMLGRAAIGSIRIAPLTIMITFIGVHQYDAMLAASHDRWIQQAEAISIGHDAEACRGHLDVLQGRISRLTLVSRVPRRLQIAELRARATLQACAGDFERAIRDQALAVQIADSLRQAQASESPPESVEQVESELIHSSELRQLAAWHAARGAFREALRATRRAEQELEVADHRATTSPPSPQREWARGTLARELHELAETRRRIIEGMGVRS